MASQPLSYLELILLVAFRTKLESLNHILYLERFFKAKTTSRSESRIDMEITLVLAIQALGSYAEGLEYPVCKAAITYFECLGKFS